MLGSGGTAQPDQAPDPLTGAQGRGTRAQGRGWGPKLARGVGKHTASSVKDGEVLELYRCALGRPWCPEHLRAIMVVHRNCAFYEFLPQKRACHPTAVLGWVSGDTLGTGPGGTCMVPVPDLPSGWHGAVSMKRHTAGTSRGRAPGVPGKAPGVCRTW